MVKKVKKRAFLVRFLDKILTLLWLTAIILFVISVSIWIYTGIILPAQLGSRIELNYFIHQIWLSNPNDSSIPVKKQTYSPAIWWINKNDLSGNLTIVYPNILAAGQNGKIHLYFVNVDLGKSLQVELSSMSDGLLFAESDTASPTQTIQIIFSGTKDEMKMVNLITTQTPSCCFNTPINLRFSIVDDHRNPIPWTQTLHPVFLETAIQKVLRDLQRTQMETSSPIFLLASVAFSSLSLLYKSTIRRTELEKAIQEADNIKKEFKLAVRNNQWGEASEQIKKLKNEFPDSKSDDPDIEAAKYLFDIYTNHEFDVDKLEKLGRTWINEIACTICSIADDVDKSKIRDYLRLFQKEQCDDEIQTQINAVQKKLDAYPIQTRVWPINKPGTLSRTTWFTSAKAEYELNDLFHPVSYLFWKGGANDKNEKIPHPC